jgi:hypothetical protein
MLGHVPKENQELCYCRNCGWQNVVVLFSKVFFCNMNHVIMVANKCVLLVLSLPKIITTLREIKPDEKKVLSLQKAF